jgi:hypothetical protein
VSQPRSPAYALRRTCPATWLRCASHPRPCVSEAKVQLPARVSSSCIRLATSNAPASHGVVWAAADVSLRYAVKKLRIVNMGKRSRRLLIVARSHMYTRTPRTFWICPSFKDPFSVAVPKLAAFIAVKHRAAGRSYRSLPSGVSTWWVSWRPTIRTRCRRGRTRWA